MTPPLEPFLLWLLPRMPGFSVIMFAVAGGIGLLGVAAYVWLRRRETLRGRRQG